MREDSWCEIHNKVAPYVLDPFMQDVYGIDVWDYFCEDCWQMAADEI